MGMTKQLNAEEIVDQLAGLAEKIKMDAITEIRDELRDWLKGKDLVAEEAPGLQAAIEFIEANYVL